MPIKRAKCQTCGYEYNIFLFSRPEKGYSFDNYPCRRCQSIKKVEIPPLQDKVEGYKKAIYEK